MYALQMNCMGHGIFEQLKLLQQELHKCYSSKHKANTKTVTNVKRNSIYSFLWNNQCLNVYVFMLQALSSRSWDR